MNWKNEAAEKLRKYSAMSQALYNIPREIQRLQIEASAIKSASMEAARGGESRREELLMNNIAHRQELQWAWEQTKCWLEVTERGLSALSREDRQILHQLYIQPEKGGLEQLCRELGVEQSSVYRRRDKALQRFAMALYGTGDRLPEALS